MKYVLTLSWYNIPRMFEFQLRANFSRTCVDANRNTFSQDMWYEGHMHT